jgi:predicted acetyltransferase
MIHLELPNSRFKETYLKAVKEFQEKGSDNESTDHYLKQDFNQLENNFEEFVDNLIMKHKGINIPENRVPSTEFWIIDEKENYCGRVSLRHKLNEALSEYGGHIGYDIVPSQRGKGYSTKALELCLKEAKQMKIDKILVTCDDNNMPSAKAIERNGGILRDKILHNQVLTRRYDIYQ